MAFGLSKEQTETVCKNLLVLPLEYRSAEDHTDCYKGAKDFTAHCKQLKQLLESDMKHEKTDIDEIYYMKEFVSDVSLSYSAESESGLGNKIKSDMQTFLQMAPIIQQGLQKDLDTFGHTPPVEGYKNGSNAPCGEMSETTQENNEQEKNQDTGGKSKLGALKKPGEIDSARGTTITISNSDLCSPATGNLPKMAQINDQHCPPAGSHLEESQDKINNLEKELEQSTHQKKDIQERLEELQQKLTYAYGQLKEKDDHAVILQAELAKALDDRTHYASRLNEQEQQLVHANATSKKQCDIIKSLEKQLDSALEEKEKYLLRLSKEMGAKVSSDESNIENISIKHRPMTVADDYHQFMADVWTEAKEALDCKAQEMDEVEKLKLLCDILKISYEEVKGLYVECRENVFETLSKLTGNAEVMAQNKIPGDIADPFSGVVKNQVADLFRMLSGSVCMGQIASAVTSRLQESNRKWFDHLSEQNILDTFITESSILAWKMIVQRPPMEYDCTGIGKSWDGGKTQNVHYGSAQPDAVGAVVQMYVFPSLYHGKSVMVKGTVFI